MEIGPRRTFRMVNFAIVAITLIVFMIVMGAMVAVTLNAGVEADKETQKFLIHLAWVALVLLGLAAVVFVWLCVRRLKEYFTDVSDNGPTRRTGDGRMEGTRHVDAWSLARKRFKLDEEDSPDQSNDEEEK